MQPTFADLGLSPKVLEAVTAAGYEIPTPIQAAAIPVANEGRDVLGIAQTGTGKTASFVLPMLTRLERGRARARMPRSLILAPTRELAAQVEEHFNRFGTNHKLTVALLIGGVSFEEQNKKLDRGADVLIATPGRLLDQFQRGKILMTGVEILVIDEADRMLDMGFIPDIERICKLLPTRRQTLFFSATMPTEIQRLVDTFLKDPVRIEVARPATTAKTITQQFRFCASNEDWEKREILRDLIRSEQVRNAIIFCNRKRDVAILHKSLVKHGFNAGALHGDMDQTSRTATLDKFRNGEIMLLAASDVAARGLDIPDVSHVFNYDIPWAGDDYVHRIGRTGRAGKEGNSLSLVTSEDLKLIKDIEKATGEQPIWIGQPPTAEDFADTGKRRGRGGRAPAAKGASRDEGRGANRGESRGEARGQGPGNRPERGERDAPREGAREGYSAARSTRPRQHGRSPRPAVDGVQTADAPSIAGEAAAQQPRQQAPAHAPERQTQERQTQERQPRRQRRPPDAIPGFGDQPAIPTGERNNDTPRAPRHQPRAAAPMQAPMQESGEARERTPDRPTPDRPTHDRPRQDRPRQERPQAERSQEGRSREDRPQRDRPQQDRPPQQERSQQARPRREGGRPSQQAAEGGNGGFADNVPAFLRRPVRPAKAVASE